jgi:hypothetical protein
MAEVALPAAVALAARVGARATLLHVLERAAPSTVHGERHLIDVGEAEAYLHGIAPSVAGVGVGVAVHAHPSPEGDIAASISAHASEVGRT